MNQRTAKLARKIAAAIRANTEWDGHLPGIKLALTTGSHKRRRRVRVAMRRRWGV